MGCLYSPSRPEEFFSETICSLTNPYALRADNGPWHIPIGVVDDTTRSRVR